MVNQIVDEIEKCLDNECFFAALALALTLPDTCGKAEYPNAKNKERYINWFDKYIGKYEKIPRKSKQEPELPYLSGEIVYQLRCCLLHQSTPGIELDRIKEECCKVDHFLLTIDDISHGVSTQLFQWEHFEPERTMKVNIVNLCIRLARTAKSYYDEFPAKFDFIKYMLYDKRHMQDKL